jgi:dienelactone hydrolase
VLETEVALACTTTGQVKTALGGETVSSLNRAEASRIRDRAPLPATRDALPEWRKRLKSDVGSLLALGEVDAPLNARTLARMDRGTHIVEKTVYYSDPGIYVPGLLFLPKKPGAAPAVVFINEDGKTGGGIIENYLRPLAEGGVAVFAIDPRGTGETAPGAPSAETSYRAFTHSQESRLMYDSLSAGVTVLGMRTRDVLRAVEYLRGRSEIDAKRISAIGHGEAGLLAMHAAALDDSIRSAAATGTLASYGAIVENEIYTHRYSMFAPGGLRKYDLPELSALVAPRTLLVINAVDQMQRPLELERAAELYAPAGKVFSLARSSAGLRIERALSAGEIVEKYRTLALAP